MAALLGRLLTSATATTFLRRRHAPPLERRTQPATVPTAGVHQRKPAARGRRRRGRPRRAPRDIPRRPRPARRRAHARGGLHGRHPYSPAGCPRGGPTDSGCRTSRWDVNSVSMATDVPLAPSDDRASRLATLFDTHHPRLYRLARRLTTSPDDALDLVQDTFVRVARTPASVPIGASSEEAGSSELLSISGATNGEERPSASDTIWNGVLPSNQGTHKKQPCWPRSSCGVHSTR